MSLTDTEIRLAKARTKGYKLADGGGLTLLVQPNGSKWWRPRYPPDNSGRAALTTVTAKKTKWMLDAFLYFKLGDVWINDITSLINVKVSSAGRFTADQRDTQ